MKRCKNCGKEVPDDSAFCQYCGSGEIEIVEDEVYQLKNVQSKTVFKRCIDCGRELPGDSDFCQYCGSKRIAVVNNSIKTEEKEIQNKKNFKVPFIVACVLCLLLGSGLGYGMYYNYKKYNEVYALLKKTTSEKESLQSRLNATTRDLESNKKKASNYDEVIRYAGYSKGYSDFYARQTLMKNPNKTKVWIYFSHYDTNVYFQASSSSVKAEWGNFDGFWCPITVTYTGNGVEYLKLTNDANSEVIYITIVGN